MLAANPSPDREAGARVAKSARRAGKGSLPGVSALAPGNEPAYAS